MGSARLRSRIDYSFVFKPANFDVCVHIGRNSRPFHFRHAELVLALPAFGSSIHRAAATHISLGKMDPETSSG
jgi:hypothetical protein